ncbi:EF1G-domain-containing protein [Punctularia strigosozonata HHB-11173 SS5]|uniref:EF1G-domain-containing protein n=1 Tax=Punctularia strigosozonata (strain HHB-11173) TaxID=741275 RepID=R7S453_PUNST|nr:EF1G-domain-containing protein [Punctularia strigosozonata HHB-11173 SS5]EIN05160.1 EF1G-domain-containing protein [Punctularia strigosozonata HHB-11173 SS5]
MAPLGKLFGPESSPAVKPIWKEFSRTIEKCLAVAAYVDLEIERPLYVHDVDNKKPDFLAKFPAGKIPTWEGSDGFLLFESTAIAKYLASLAPDSGLLPTDPRTAALVNQWVSFAEKEIQAMNFPIYQITHGIIAPYNKTIHAHFVAQQFRGFDVVEKHLATRTFLVGERITLADISLAMSTLTAVYVTLGSAARAKYPNVIRHLETIVYHPKIKSVFGEIAYQEKAMEYVPPPKEKEPKGHGEPNPKPEKKKKKNKAVEEDEEDDDLAPKEEPKAKNPLDLLPKSSFNLEDWKRAYSNKDTRGSGGSLEWFYEYFDPEGFSVWRVDFKYNDELTQTFMSSNQIGGFFNRLEASRKYLFGSMGVLGATNDSILTGVLVCRGKDIKSAVEVAPDWESYDYTPINLSDVKQKAFFEGALAWDLEIDGKAWADGKNVRFLSNSSSDTITNGGPIQFK